MKARSIINKIKDVNRDIKLNTFNTVETKSQVNHERGRMEYLGVDMAFIYIRGKLMFTMSEVARKLYPQWARTTLNDRVKQMKIQWHTCTPKEIEKVLSVKGIVKLGVHCTLISKDDLDTFCSVYKVGTPAGSRKLLKPTPAIKEIVNENGGGSRNSRKRVSVGGSGSRIKLQTDIKSMPRRNHRKQNKHVNKHKGTTRAIVKDTKVDNGTILQGHVFNEVDKATGKHTHVVKPCRDTSKQSNKMQMQVVGRPKKRKFSTLNFKQEPQTESHGYIPTKRHRKMRETSHSSDSDCVSYDSGISSLQLDARPTPRKTAGRTKKICVLAGRPVAQKSQKQLKIKEVKKKYSRIKTKKTKQTTKEIVVGSKRMSENVKRGRKGKKGEGIKKMKVDKYSCSNTITKDLIMKMDLKHMNDKDLIDSFSPLSSPMGTTPSEEQPYLVKLMPVKPVWRVNSSFRFISNFQLPPSLIVQEGQLSPACSMICNSGQKPPSAHPIWKWKLGEPVVSNKTVISYRVKKVKCT